MQTISIDKLDRYQSGLNDRNSLKSLRELVKNDTLDTAVIAKSD